MNASLGTLKHLEMIHGQVKKHNSKFRCPGNHCGLKLFGTSFHELAKFPGSNTTATPAKIQCSAVLEHLMGKVNEQHCRA